MRYRNPVTGVVSEVPAALAGVMGLVPVVDEALAPAAAADDAAPVSAEVEELETEETETETDSEPEPVKPKRGRPRKNTSSK